MREWVCLFVDLFVDSCVWRGDTPFWPGHGLALTNLKEEKAKKKIGPV